MTEQAAAQTVDVLPPSPIAELVAALLAALTEVERGECAPLIEQGMEWVLVGEQAEQLQVTCRACGWGREGSDEEELEPQAQTHALDCQPTPALRACGAVRRVIGQYEQAWSRYHNIDRTDPGESTLALSAPIRLETLEHVVVELAAGYGVHACVDCGALAVTSGQRTGPAEGQRGPKCERHAGPAHRQPDGWHRPGDGHTARPPFRPSVQEGTS